MYRAYKNFLQVDGLTANEWTFETALTNYDGLFYTPSLNMQSAAFPARENAKPLFDTGGDYPADITTTAVITIGTATNATVDFENDIDWFSVSLTAGEVFEVYGDAFSMIQEFRFYDASGALLTGLQFDDGIQMYASLVVPTTGTYFVAAHGDVNTGSYAFNSRSYIDDFAADISTTGILPTNGSVSGSLQGGTDSDWFAITLNAGDTLNITSNLQELSTTFFLRDSAGAYVTTASINPDMSGDLHLDYDVTASGTYYIDVMWDLDIFPALNYTLNANVSATIPDLADNTSTIGVATIDSTTTSFFDFASDTDWFAVTLSAGENLQIIYDTLLYIDIANVQFYDASGTLIADTFNEVDGLAFVENYAGFTAAAAGTYYVAFTGSPSGPPADGEYGFVSRTTFDEYAADTSTAGTVVLGQSISGTLQTAGDEDWIAITLTDGETVTIAVNVNGEVNDIHLRDASGQIVASNIADDPFSPMDLTYDVTAAGSYYISIGWGGINGGALENTNYTIDTSSIPTTVDLAGDTSTLGTLAIGGTSDSDFNSTADHDWFAITVTAGQQIRFNILNGPTDFAGFESSTLRLYNSNGNQITSSSNTELIYTFNTADTYYIAGISSDIGTYTIAATEIPADLADNTSTTGTISIGETVTSYIDTPYDEDWFQFTAAEGQIIHFALASSAQGNLRLRIYNDNGSTNSYINSFEGGFRATTAGTYYVEVDTFNYTSGSPSYTLTATEVFDDYADDSSTTGTIATGQTVNGEIEYAYDKDWFAFTLSAGEAIQFETTHSENGYFTVYIREANGNYISSSSTYDINTIIVNGLSAGTYYLSVQAPSNATSSYSITASAPPDDYAANVNTTANFNVGSSITGNIDYRNDHDWLAIDLTAGEAVQFLSGNGNVYFSLVDANGDTVHESRHHYDQNLDQYVIGIAGSVALTGTYYIDVSNYSNTVYEIFASTVTDDFLASVATTGTLTDDTVTTGVSNFYQDKDWFAFSANAEDSVFFTVGLDGQNSYINFTIFDSAGQQIAQTSAYSLMEFGHIFDTAGTYYIEVQLSTDTEITYELTSQTGVIFGTNASDFLQGTAIDDTIIGMSGDDTLLGHDGNDILEGRGGRDILSGGAGDDILRGGNQNDNLQGGAGNDTLIGGYGADTLIGGAGADNLDGDGDGSVSSYGDLLSYVFSDAGVNVNLETGAASGGHAEGDTFANFENLHGSDFSDTLVGNSSANIIVGAGGADTLTGNGGNDVFVFGVLDDVDGDVITDYHIGDRLVMSFDEFNVPLIFVENNNFSGSLGEVRYFASGNDTIVEIDIDGDEISDASLTLQGYTGLLAGSSNYGSVTITTPYNQINGTSSTEVLNGTPDNDAIYGLEGTDYLYGYEGDDYLFGGEGRDRLDGGAGDDVLYGGADSDTLVGGEGADILDGGVGDFDAVDYRTSSAGISVNLATGVGTGGDAEGDTLIDIESVVGSDFDDVIVGNADDNYLRGGQGVDSFDGGDGTGDRVSFYDRAATQGVIVDLSTGIIANDGFGNTETLVNIESIGGGTAFVDTYTGDANDNLIVTTGFGDIVDAGAGDDRIHIQSAGTFDGGDGIDTLIFLTTPFNGQLYRVVVDTDSDGIADFEYTTNGIHVDLSLGMIVDDGFGDSGTVTNIENIDASGHADILIGDSADNEITGQGGDDTIDGGAGIDTAIYNGASLSEYTISFNTAGSMVISHNNGGTDGTDTLSNIEFIRINEIDYALTALTENIDNYTGSLLDDIINALDGNDTVHGGLGNDIISGGSGHDRLFGDDGDDTLLGGDGADRLYGGAGADNLSGGAGNDRFYGDAGADNIDGGVGFDTVYYTSSTSFVAVNLAGNGSAGDADGDTYTSIERVFGSDFNDLLSGDGANNQLFGGTGDDMLSGGAGADVLNGGDGTDTASYESAFAGVIASLDMPASNTNDAAGDTYASIENLIGSAFDDSLTGDALDNVLTGGAGADILDGGVGTDTASYAGATARVDLSLATGGTVGDAAGDTFMSIEVVVGSDFDDDISGTAGNDTLIGGAGNDDLTGGAGADELIGGAGYDRVFYDQASTGIVANMVNSALNTGDAAGDTYDSIEALYGSQFNDFMTGDSGNNRLVGFGGNDILVGARGNDSLFGGNGNDRLLGGNGNDALFGQGGFDVYVIRANAGTDKIYGFEDGADVIEYRNGPASFSDLGITQVGGDVHIISSNGTTILVGFNIADVDAADFTFLAPAPPAEAPATEKTTVSAQSAQSDDLDVGVNLAQDSIANALDILIMPQPGSITDASAPAEFMANELDIFDMF